jgi:hypothetical protein
MSADSGISEPSEKEEDLWRMPQILTVEVIRVHYRKPIEYFMKSKPVHIQEAMEFLVKTSEEFPIRALSPALFVEDFPVTEVSHVGENLYRFVAPAPELERLKTGAAISIGWAGVRGKKMTTNFRFQIQREDNR